MIIENTTIKASYWIGTISAELENSVLEDCHVGDNSIIIANSKNTYGSYIGGLIGNINGTSDKCKILNCSNKSEISSFGNYVGGIVGYGRGQIEACYNEGEITVLDGANNTGGIVGTNQILTISNCYNKGNIIGLGTNKEMGGIVGRTHSGEVNVLKINNCYNRGNIEGTTNIGGIIGVVSKTETIVKNTYNMGNVTGNSNIGGIIGVDNSGGCTFENNYYLKDTNYTNTLGNEEEELDKQLMLNVINTGNTKEIWTNDEQDKEGKWIYNNGYPILKWQISK